jgi:hypothetical protein
MRRIQQFNVVGPVLAAAAVFFCTGLSTASLFVKIGPGELTRENWEAIVALTSPLLFLCASILAFFRPNVGYVVGGIAGAVASPWLVLVVSSVRPSVWAYLNGPDELAAIDRPNAVLAILSVAFTAAAATCSLLRLLPSWRLLRNSHVRRRTWPAVAVAVLVTAAWFCHSAKPWMLPTIVDAVTPELRILRVEKRGLQFHETSVTTMRNGVFWVRHNDRRLLQYQFENRITDGTMPDIIRERANVFAHSTTLRNLRTAPPIALRSWNAEGWYATLNDSPLLAFTSEYGTNPPPEIRNMFEQIEKLPGTQRSIVVQDVCLGFCYDPIAGLGFWYSNQRWQWVTTSNRSAVLSRPPVGVIRR